MTNSIRSTLVDLRQQNEGALIAYWPLGYPTLEQSLKYIKSLSNGGADILELGLPFSDPCADGNTLQIASKIALSHNPSIANYFEAINTLRQEMGISQPIALMGYLNTFLSVGFSRFCELAENSNIQGLIIPDLPPEEATLYLKDLNAHRLESVFFISENTLPKRRQLIADASSGFIYLLARQGVTGAQHELSSSWKEQAREIGRLSETPICLGFGLSTPVHASEALNHVDGVIFASRLINETLQGNSYAPGKRKRIEQIMFELKKSTKRQNNK